MYGIKEISAALDDFGLIGDPQFDNFADLDKAVEGSIVWMRSTNAEHLYDNPASVVVCKHDYSDQHPDKCFVIVDNPRLAFVKILNHCHPERRSASIDTLAWVHPGAELGEGVHIGTGAVIGLCTIGNRTRIDEGVVIKDGVVIGDNCHIMTGAVIGADGFGYERDKDGKLHKFQSLGTVLIGDDVDIGANSTVDKGALRDTIIGRGTKIDNLVDIAHGAHIGSDVAIAGFGDVSGSVTVGDKVYIAPHASITNDVKIGTGAFIGIGAVVTRDVPDYEVWMGVPAREIRLWRAQQRYLNSFKWKYRL